MLGDIRRDLKPKEYEIALCKPNRETIAFLTDAYNIKYEAKYKGVDEITFDIPYYIEDEFHNQIKNPNYDLILGDYLLLVNDEKYFMIDVSEENGSNGVDFKSIHAYSLEYELIYKNLRLFRGTRKIYDATSEKSGILNLLEEDTTWKIGHIDDSVKMDTNGSHEKYRTFDISEKTWLDVLSEDIPQAFDCVLIFDTINKIINVYDKNSYGQNKGLYISESNYLKTIGKKTEHNKIVTRLYIYGKDNISINSVNPLGTDYIENFDYYKNTKYMSQSLIDKLNTYEDLLESKTTVFQGYVNSLNELYEELALKETEISNLNTDLQIILDNIDTAILSDMPYAELNVDKKNKQNEINTAQSEKDNIQKQIDNVMIQIKDLQQLLRKENNFTSEELEQLDYFIKRDSMQDNYISDSLELYNRGKSYLAEMNIPPITFSIDIVDFLKIVDFQYDWDKLILGDKINIEYKKLGIDVEVRLIGYSHDYDGNSLSLKFTNKDEGGDEYDKVSSLLSNATNTSTSVNIFKNQWDTAYSNVSETQSFMNSALNTARNAVLSGRNQNIIINERGITLKDMNSEVQQIKMINNCIAFTEDNWETASLSLTPKGIVAKNLYGQVIGSEKLIITNTEGSFLVDGSHMSAVNMDLSLTTNDGQSNILIDPENGIKIRTGGIGSWEDRFYVDMNGDLTANNMIANELRTSNTSNYTILHDQYIDFYNDGEKVLTIGFVDFLEFFPIPCIFNNDSLSISATNSLKLSSDSVTVNNEEVATRTWVNNNYDYRLDNVEDDVYDLMRRVAILEALNGV